MAGDHLAGPGCLALRADRARRQPVAVSPAPDDGGLGLTFAKLALFPTMVWLLSGLLPGLNDSARTVLVLLAACPSGVNVMAFCRTAEDNRSVSAAISLSTLLSAVTLPLWMMVMGI